QGRPARGVHDERAVERLPILADALEQSGCKDEAIPGHLRGSGPHLRGCGPRDLILGRGSHMRTAVAFTTLLFAWLDWTAGPGISCTSPPRGPRWRCLPSGPGARPPGRAGCRGPCRPDPGRADRASAACPSAWEVPLG